MFNKIEKKTAKILSRIRNNDLTALEEAIFYEIDESHFKALQLIWETSSDREKLLSHVC